MTNPIMDAVEKIASGFEEYKKVNDAREVAEAAGNIARAKELQATMDKINESIGDHEKNKAILEKRLAQQQERIEIVEALADRPRATVQDKIRSEHKDLFMRWLRSGGKDHTAEEEYRNLAKKAAEMKVSVVVLATDASGGFGLPEEISRSVDQLVLAQSEILANVKNVQVGTSDYKELISINEATSGWATEVASRTATNTPVLRQRTPTWGELYALPAASNWSLEDIFFSVEAWLTQNVSDQFAQAIDLAIYSGSGSGRPTGLVNTVPTTNNDYGSPMRSAEALEYIPLTSPSSPHTSSGVTADSLIDLVNLLRQPYHNGAKFAMNRATRGHVRKLKDTNGQYLWQPSFQAGLPDMLLGYPIFVFENLGGATTANAYPVMFGNFMRGYTFVTRQGTSILRDPYSTKGTTFFYVAKRCGGILTNNDAIKVLKVAVS